VSFNPITNQPLMDYKTQQNMMEKEQEIKDFNNQKQMMEYNNDKYQQINRNQREAVPIEYNPYKQPYSIYQGHP
jgi:hypothetical protein